METSEKRLLERIPLADFTNTAADTVSGGGRTPKASRANSLAGPIKPHLSNKRKPKKNSSNRSETGANDIRRASNPSSLSDDVSPAQRKASNPIGAHNTSSNLKSANRKRKEKVVVEPFSFRLRDTRHSDVFPTLYTQRNAAANGKIYEEKAVAKPSSCPPLERTRKTAANEKNREKPMAEPSSCPPPERMRSEFNKGGEICLSKSYSAPSRKKLCAPENDPENDPLQDFIRKQTAYFSEVDAFELPVEVVPDSESE